MASRLKNWAAQSLHWEMLPPPFFSVLCSALVWFSLQTSSGNCFPQWAQKYFFWLPRCFRNLCCIARVGVSNISWQTSHSVHLLISSVFFFSIDTFFTTCLTIGLTAFTAFRPFMSILLLACSLKCSCNSSLVDSLASHITHLCPSSWRGSFMSDFSPTPSTAAPLILLVSSLVEVNQAIK